MRHHRFLLPMLLVLALCMSLVCPAYAATDNAWTSSDQVLDLIEKYEGFSATVYYDDGVGYIGFGSNYSDAQKLFGSGVSSITRDQARTLTRSQLTSIEGTLNRFLNRNDITINQNQFDALADLTYNIGVGWTAYLNADGTGCMLKELLLKGASAWTASAVESAFGAWCKAGGTVLPGLVARRAEEAALFLSDCSTSAGDSTDFSDVAATAWYADYVSQVRELGLMSGYGDGTFGPEDTLTRAQVVKILANLDGADLSAYTGTQFSDVPAGEWYASCISWAYGQGYVTGCGDGTFHPEDPISRQDLCTILARYLKNISSANGSTSVTFADDSQIASYAKSAVCYCSSWGIVNGTGDGCFSPEAQATRAEAAAMLCRIAAQFF